MDLKEDLLGNSFTRIQFLQLWWYCAAILGKHLLSSNPNREASPFVQFENLLQEISLMGFQTGDQ